MPDFSQAMIEYLIKQYFSPSKSRFSKSRYNTLSGRIAWQRSYHDHIIRDEAALNRLREYVLHNPAL